MGCCWHLAERPGMPLNILQSTGQHPHSKEWPSPECQQCHGEETLLWKELPQCHSDFLSSDFRPAPCQRHTRHPDHRSPKGPDIPKTRTKPMCQSRWADLHQPRMPGESHCWEHPPQTSTLGRNPLRRKTLMLQNGSSPFSNSAKNYPLWADPLRLLYKWQLCQQM